MTLSEMSTGSAIGLLAFLAAMVFIAWAFMRNKGKPR
jgi:hypothetical protein